MEPQTHSPIHLDGAHTPKERLQRDTWTLLTTAGVSIAVAHDVVLRLPVQTMKALCRDLSDHLERFGPERA